jgi:hypothetical protein
MAIFSEHLVHARGRQLGQPVGQLERFRVGHLERRGEVHFRRLRLDGRHHLGPVVAGVDAPQPGYAIEDLPAMVVPVVHAGGLDQHARSLLELPAGGEGHPERVEIGFHRGLLLKWHRLRRALGDALR